MQIVNWVDREYQRQRIWNMLRAKNPWTENYDHGINTKGGKWMKFEIACPNCYSTDLEIDEKKMEKSKIFKDRFICKICENKFELKNASYSK